MTRKQLIEQIFTKKSFLCIGLDTDINMIPEFLLDFEDPVFEFNKRIIDSTQDLCVAYKPNSAFYESRGLAGWKSLMDTWAYLPKSCLRIIDAKRGDTPNISKMYAKAFFDQVSSGVSFDAITINPYMGSDSVKPFLAYEDKWVILLALTSNEGSKDFQFFVNEESYLFESVVQQACTWAADDRLMFVVGATWGDAFLDIRKFAPNHFLLVPGGVQGANLKTICEHGINKDCGLLINVSRPILYASKGEDFAEKARQEALKIKEQMTAELEILKQR